MPTGYCTVDDVRRVLLETDIEFNSGALGAAGSQAVVDAIAGQSEWLRSQTTAHWYVPGGVAGDTQALVPTAPCEFGPETRDIPTTPHPQHSTTFQADRGRYPHRTAGPYCRLRLSRAGVDTLQSLTIREASGGRTDWVAAADKQPPDEYELVSEASEPLPQSYLHLRAAALPPLRQYDHAVRVTYEYGIPELPGTIRRVVALRAAAELVADDEFQAAIPDSGQLVNVETKGQRFESAADDLLEPYRQHPI